jgi:tRNA(His) 5'-end guanylyltransferase
VRALALMNAAACAVVQENPDVCIAYGVSDEYRLVLSFHFLSVLPAFPFPIREMKSE